MPDPIPAPIGYTPTPPAIGFGPGGDGWPGAPAPPDWSEWWDVEATTANVLAQLRFEQADVDVGRIRSLVPAAGHLINAFLDRYEPLPDPVPAPIQAGIEQAVVELYRRKDSAQLQAGYAHQGELQRYAAVDVLSEVAPQLTPWRQRWGFA